MECHWNVRPLAWINKRYVLINLEAKLMILHVIACENAWESLPDKSFLLKTLEFMARDLSSQLIKETLQHFPMVHGLHV